MHLNNRNAEPNNETVQPDVNVDLPGGFFNIQEMLEELEEQALFKNAQRAVSKWMPYNEWAKHAYQKADGTLWICEKEPKVIDAKIVIEGLGDVPIKDVDDSDVGRKLQIMPSNILGMAIKKKESLEDDEDHPEESLEE